MNKKGNVEDVLTIAVVFFTSAVVLYTLFYVGDTIRSNVVIAPTINESAKAVAAINGISSVTSRLDYVLLFLFIGLLLGMIVSSYFVGGHPIFMLFYGIIACIAVFISAVLANCWESITASAGLVAVLTSFPITNHIVLNLPFYIAATGFIGAVVMFAKPYPEGGYA